MIRIDFDNTEILRAQFVLASLPGSLKKALRRTMRRVHSTITRDIVKQTTANYFLKSAQIRKGLSSYVKDDGLEIHVSGKRLTLADYYMTPRKRPKKWQGLYGAVKKSGGMKYFPRGFFIMRGQNPVPFMRVGKGRWTGIEAIISPSVSQAVGNPENIEPVIKNAQEKFAERLKHEVMYELGMFAKR